MTSFAFYFVVLSEACNDRRFIVLEMCFVSTSCRSYFSADIFMLIEIFCRRLLSQKDYFRFFIKMDFIVICTLNYDSHFSLSEILAIISKIDRKFHNFMKEKTLIAPY